MNKIILTFNSKERTVTHTIHNCKCKGSTLYCPYLGFSTHNHGEPDWAFCRLQESRCITKEEYFKNFDKCPLIQTDREISYDNGVRVINALIRDLGNCDNISGINVSNNEITNFINEGDITVNAEVTGEWVESMKKVLHLRALNPLIQVVKNEISFRFNYDELIEVYSHELLKW